MLDDALSFNPGPMTARQRWTIFVASTGGALEVFDFVIYGFFAQHIGRAFFPSNMGLSTATLSFAVLAIGHLSRPLGGMFLGRLGDKYGRRVVFTSSAIVAAMSTLAIGALPSYAAVGVVSPVVLLMLRLIQGLCLGGELPGAVVYAVETTPASPGLMCGIVFFAVNVSLLLASSVNLAVHLAFNAAQVDAFGWRIGFLLGGIAGLAMFAVRRTLAETEEYARAVGRRHREPLAVLFREHRAPLVTGVGTGVLTGVTGGLVIAYMPTWLQTLGYDARSVAYAQTLHVIVVAFCIIVAAHAGDRLGRRRVFGTGALLSAVFAPLFFVALAQRDASLATWFFIAGVVASFTNGTYACAIAELFPVDVRFSGVATAMNLGLAVSMGLTPLAASFLVADLQWTPAPALVMVAGAAMSFAASFGMKSARRRG